MPHSIWGLLFGCSSLAVRDDCAKNHANVPRPNARKGELRAARRVVIGYTGHVMEHLLVMLANAILWLLILASYTGYSRTLDAGIKAETMGGVLNQRLLTTETKE